jgi:hypothetical protein
MSSKDVNAIGLVGARSYELQAWQSPSANALEEAYWATSVPDDRPPLKSRLMRVLDGLSGAAVIVATPK